MSIAVKNVTKIYGAQKALDNVSFEINPGEIVGLLGPNGAGKTTMMKIITCFIPPTSGEVSVYGYDILEESVEVRKHIGYLPENNPLYLDMYVKEYLEFIAGIHNINNKQRIIEMIRTTGLDAEQNKKISALSKGFRQRVGLAQVLIHDPDALILDEPTAGLDPNQIIEIRNLIKKIGKEKTIILSTHIMQEVEAVCDRAIIINEGRIVADDSTSELSKSIMKNEIIIVEFKQQVDKDKFLELSEIKQIKQVDKNTILVEASSGSDIRADIFQFAVKNDLTVLSMNKESQTLEKVFQKLTGK